MAEGESCSWNDYDRIWSAVTGQRCVYKQVTHDEMVRETPDEQFGIELADMFTYSSDPGYDGGMNLVKAEDLRQVCSYNVFVVILLTSQAGIDCPMTSLKEFISREDWTAIIDG